MSKETLLQLVERLREAGQQEHDADGYRSGVDEHNAAVDEAAKALAAEIENIANPQEWLAKALLAERSTKTAYYRSGHRSDAIAWDIAKQELEQALKEAYS